MALSWTDAAIVQFSTQIKKTHIDEIRTYLDNHILQAGSNASPQHLIAIRSGDGGLPGGRPGFMSAAQAQDLYNAVTLTNGTLTNVTTTANSGLTSSIDGSAITIDSLTATTSNKGMLSATDKTKLDTYPSNYSTVTTLIATKGQVNSISVVAPIAIDNSTPSSPVISIPAATISTNGLQSATDKSKLDSLDAFPQGTIIEWYGDYNIFFEANGRGRAGLKFAKWHLANGQAAANGYVTPNLIGRFTVGASTSYKGSSDSPCLDVSIGAKQYLLNGQNANGEVSHILKDDEVPAHRHITGQYNNGSNNDLEIYTASIASPATSVTLTDVDGRSGLPGDNTSFHGHWETTPYNTAANTRANFTWTNKRLIDATDGKAHNNIPPFFATFKIIKTED